MKYFLAEALSKFKNLQMTQKICRIQHQYLLALPAIFNAFGLVCPHQTYLATMTSLGIRSYHISCLIQFKSTVCQFVTCKHALKVKVFRCLQSQNETQSSLA